MGREPVTLPLFKSKQVKSKIMADKQFIGKVFEKTFNNGGSIIKLTLSESEKSMLEGLDGDTTIEVKKSQKGKWYAEISQYQERPTPIDDTPF
jgi:hypothetical protein